MIRFHIVVSLGVCLLTANMVVGQEVISVPEDAKFVVQVDVGAFGRTTLGGKLVALTKRLAEEELGTESGEIMQRIEETVGFNPLEEVQSLTVIGRSFEDAEEDLQVILRLRKTTGNLEGLMLALPNYTSEEEGDRTIHSFREGDMSAQAVIHTSQDGNKTILAATNRADVLDLLQSLDASTATFRKRKTISWVVPEGTFAQIQLLQFPEELMDHDQAGNIARLIKDAAITVGEQGGDLAASLILTTSDEKKAEQIQQLVTGLRAMVGLFKDEIGDDQDAQMALSIAEKVSAHREGETVVIEASIPQALIIQFLKEEADLPL